MNEDLLEKIDQLVLSYRKNHKNQAPLYIVVSPDEAKAVRESIREKENRSEDFVITTYGESKIAEHPSLLNGKMYVSNELPETGS